MQDASRGEVINLCDMAACQSLIWTRPGWVSPATQAYRTRDSPGLGAGFGVDKGEKVTLAVKRATTSFCHSGFFLTPIKLTPLIPYGDVGTSLPDQMSAHIL